MLTTIITVVTVAISVIAARGIDFGIAISGVLVGLSVLFEMSDFNGKNTLLKSLKSSLAPHMKIFIVIFAAFFLMKMLSFIH